MTLQVLVSTMNQSDYSLLEKMNIQCDAIVVNQCNENKIDEFIFKGHKIKWISLNEKGVGLSRNTALMRSNADILLIADDDVVYDDGFVDLVTSEYTKYKNADIITFNLKSLNPERQEILDTKSHRLHWYNSLKYGAFRISIKREYAFKYRLSFSLLFGGGAPYQAGEDNLFLIDALKKRAKAFSSTSVIGTVEQKESTWFKGFDEKYYVDRGFLFASMFGRKASLLLLLFEMRKKTAKNYSFSKRYKLGRLGIKQFFK